MFQINEEVQKAALDAARFRSSKGILTVYHPKAQLYFLLTALPGEPSPHGRPRQTQTYILSIQQLPKRKGFSPSSSGIFSDLNFTGPLLRHLLAPEPITTAWWATVQGVTKSRRRLSDSLSHTHTLSHTHSHTHTHTHSGQEGRIC